VIRYSMSLTLVVALIGMFLCVRHFRSQRAGFPGIRTTVALLALSFAALVFIGYRDRTLAVMMASTAERIRAEEALRNAQSRQMRTALMQTEVATTAAAGDQPESAWLPEVERLFPADVYPSLEAAARHLARIAPPAIGRVSPDSAIPEQMVVFTYGSRVIPTDRIPLEEFASTLRTAYPAARVVALPPLTDGMKHRDSGIAVGLSCGGGDGTSRQPTHAEAFTGRMTATVNGRVLSEELHADVIEKPWLDESRFLSTPEGRSRLVVRSARLHSTAAAARDDALDEARRLVLPIVGSAGRHPQAAAFLTREVQRQLAQGDLVADRFVQRLETPHGAVWREALLLDLDTARLSALHSGAQNEALVTERQGMSRVAGLCFIMAAIVVLYWLLDWITRGYHRRSLSLFLGLVAMGGLTLLLLIA